MTKQSKLAVSIGLGLIPMVLMAYEYGPDPRNTAAPGDNPLACSQASCHTSAAKGGPLLTSTAGANGVFATFSSGTTYTPGVPVTITVMVKDSTNTHYGFQMSARLESDLANGQAGDFTAGTNQLVICDATSSGQPKGTKGCPANALVQFIEHSFPAGSQVSTTPYTFTWTPPATNVGNVHFYVAGNAVNGNIMADGGDHVYSNAYVLTPAAAALPPTISSVNSGSDFGGMPNFAPGSWIEIKGANLAVDTRIWGGGDFNGSAAPTMLDGTSVSIDGKAAFVYYISPTQINAQVPADSNVGPVAITVTNPAATSPAFTGQLASVVPGMLASSAFNVNGTQYMVAQYLDQTYVGNTNLIPGSGVTFRPAKPGDLLTAYGIGFGAVTPASPPGMIVSGLDNIPNVSMTLGGVSITPSYAGLAGGLVGLYQFNFNVPSVPNGDQPVTVGVGGVSAQSGLFLTIHN